MKEVQDQDSVRSVGDVVGLETVSRKSRIKTV